MRMEHLLIAFVVMSVILSTGFMMFDEQINYHNISADTGEFSDLRDQLDRAMLTTQGQDSSDRDKVTGQVGDGTSVEDDMFRGGFSALKGFAGSVAIMGNITTTIMQDSGLITWNLGTGFIIIISISVTTFLIYMVLRFKPQ